MEALKLTSAARHDKWKAENREKNRRLERERKERLVTVIHKLQKILPDTFLGKECCPKHFYFFLFP